MFSYNVEIVFVRVINSWKILYAFFLESRFFFAN